MRERAVHASRGGMGEQTGESGLCCMHEYARDWSQTGLSPAGQLCSTRPRLAGTRIGPHLDMVKACAGLLSAPGSRRLRFVSIHVNRGMMSPKVREVFQAAAASRDAREGSVCAETSVLGALVAPVGSRKPLLHTVNDNERMSVSPGSHLSALALGEEAQQDPLRSPEKMSDQAPDAEAELPSLLIRSGNSYYLEPAYNKPANQRPSLNIL